MVSGLFSIPIEPCGTTGDGRTTVACWEKPLRRFIGGPENRLVECSYRRFTDEPNLNPIVLFGPTGCGKTMLAQAMLLQWRARFPHAATLSTTGADLARSFSLALETDAIGDFLIKHASVDLLLIDDIDHLVNKPAAQQMLLDLHDRLIRQNRRLLVTSRHILPGLPSFSNSLASRLWGGLTVPLALPAADTRKALVDALAETHDLHLDQAVVRLLANCQSLRSFPLKTVPQINHALLQMRHNAAADQVDIDVDFACRFLDCHKQEKTPSLRDITSLVGKHYGLRVSQLRSATRRHAVVRARGVAMFLARRLTDLSLQQIGHHFGGRDHTTVLHACRQIEELRNKDHSLQLTIETLECQLTSPVP